ncbi:hypothetical protein ThvES_00020250 [Thiovulum sp. ES]|nr:hypothetical protein ThvES_00020250 [Thiovulum sp. ES]
MAFIPSKYKTVSQALRDVQSDIVVPFLTVHDEVDFLVDFNIHKPLLKKMVDIGHNKAITDKLGMPYINMLFDVEYSKDGSWIPDSSFDPYHYPYSEYEDIEQRQYHKVFTDIRGTVTNTQEELSTSKHENPIIIIASDISKLEDFLEEAQATRNGNHPLKVQFKDGNSFTYSRLIDKKDLKSRLIEKSIYTF